MPDSELELTKIQRQQLYDALLSAFPTRGELGRFLNFELDTDLEMVAGGETYADVVFNLVKWAIAQGQVEALVVGARKDNPGNPLLRRFDEQVLGHLAPEKVTKPRVAAPQPEDNGEATALPAVLISGDDRFALSPVEHVGAWFAGLQHAAAAVCRLELHNGFATAFLIGPDLVVTCYHVCKELIEDFQSANLHTARKNALPPEGVALRFGYTLGPEGLARPGDVYRLAADWLVDCSPIEDLDYVLMRVDGQPGMDEVEDDGGKRRRDWLRVPDTYEFKRDAPLYLLQHANAQPLQVSYGTGARTQGNRVEFSALTAPGSSGSPFFSARWELVGLYESRRDVTNPSDSGRIGIPMTSIVTQPRVRAVHADFRQAVR